jgi:hypothetical protein
MIRRVSTLILCLALGISVAGCRSAGDPQLVRAHDESVVIGFPLEQAWEHVRDTLIEKEYDVYTRDKRGLLIGYTKMKRRGLLIPHRTKFTIVLEKITNESTEITVESVHQRYQVTFLTYPGWRDMEIDSEALEDKELGHDLLMAIQDFSVPSTDS